MPSIDPLTLNLLFICVIALAAWFPCCSPYDPPPCGICTDDDDALSITIAGLSNNSCSGCTSYNATFLLARSSGNACKWVKTGYRGACGSVAQYYDMYVEAKQVTLSSVGFHAEVKILSTYSGAGHWEYMTRRWSSGSLSDFDCTANRTTTAVIYYQDAGCDGWASATIEINP